MTETLLGRESEAGDKVEEDRVVLWRSFGITWENFLDHPSDSEQLFKPCRK